MDNRGNSQQMTAHLLLLIISCVASNSMTSHTIDVNVCPQSCTYELIANGTIVTCHGCNNWQANMTFPNDTVKLFIRDTITDTSMMEQLLGNLYHLQNLTLWNISVETLSVKMFADLNNLMELQILECRNVRTLQTGVFGNLVKLLRFRVTWSKQITFREMSTAIGEANTPSLHTLIIDHQGVFDSESAQVLDMSFYKLLRNKNLSIVVLSNDFIETLNPGYSQYLPHVTCIKVQGNIITRTMLGFMELFTMQELLYLDISDEDRTIEQYQPPGDINTICEAPVMSSSEVGELDPKLVNETLMLMEKVCPPIFPNARMTLFPNVRYLFGRKSLPSLKKSEHKPKCIDPNNHIRYMDASQNAVDYSYPMIGFLRLQYFNVRESGIRVLHYHTFGHFPELTTLLLGGNKLGNSFKAGNATYALRNLTKLVTLDLSKNNISNLSIKDRTLVLSIHDIDLAGNNLTEEDFNFTATLGFTNLDLTNNQLINLPQKFRENLNKYAKTTPFKLDLSHNPLQCRCDNLEFLDWFLKHKSYFINLKSHRCFASSKSAPTEITKELIDKLHETCKRRQTTKIIIAVFAFIGTLTLMCFSYRHRNQLNYYLCFYTQLKFKQFTLKLQNYEQLTNQLEFDVFVAYNYHDHDFVRDHVKPQLTKRGFKLYIAEDEFQAGQSTVRSIDNAIDKCTCTLLIVSHHFVKSTWCSYEILASLAQRKKVIVLSLSEVKMRQMPAGLIYLGRKTRQIYPQDKTEKVSLKFWSNLAAALRDNDNPMAMTSC